jgi:hypothetical protein
MTIGHYEMALPWKNYPPCLQNNKSLAQHRLNLLKRKLEKDPMVFTKYKDFMADLLRIGYARRVYYHHLGLSIPIGTYSTMQFPTLRNLAKSGLYSTALPAIVVLR